MTAPAGATVAVVGGGPAGLMAAERLATAGLHVTVYERMPSVGRKFLLAGRGGLNLTHSEPEDALLGRYGPAASAARLDPAVRAFGQAELRAWAEGLGQPTFVGSSGRVFPLSFRATPLLRAWLGRLRDLGVELRVRHTWTGWADPAPAITVADGDGRGHVVFADAVVLAMGGASWPRVGSDGRWVAPMEAAGIAVHALRPANCGFVVDWSGPFVARFGGTPLKNVELSGAGGRVRGEALVTATGIEGGAVYALSARLRDGLEEHGAVALTIDIRPDLTAGDLGRKLERRRPKDSLSTVLRRAGLAPVAAGLMRESRSDGGRLPADPHELAALAKAVPIVLRATQPIARAISTAGGIDFAEVDDHLMLRRRPGTFVAGEMLDWEAPTGGYLLQATFSTAVAAADGVSAWLARSPTA